MMTLRFPRTSLIVPTLVAVGFITAATQAHAQFGGLFQSVINSAVQQGTNQAAANAAAAAIGNQVSPQMTSAGNLSPAQVNALSAAAAAIPQNDPEYQALMMQSLAQVPANQRSAVVPIIDMQVRQALASRRLGYAANNNAYGLNAANTNNNPMANAAVQAALAQGLANNGGLNAAALNGQAGQAAAAGALIQGLSSLFGSSSTPAQPTATTQP